VYISNKYSKDNSKYVKQMLETQHEYGKIGQTMDILTIKEQFYIYKFDKEGLTTNEQHTNQDNILFSPKK
jgi:hypothetical protein